MANRAGLRNENMDLLIDGLTAAFSSGQLSTSGDGTVTDKRHGVRINEVTGNWVGSVAGIKKDNQRAYVNLPLDGKKVLVTNYNYLTVYRALVAGDKVTLQQLRDGYVVNHMNGQTLRGDKDVIEVTTVGGNNVHSASMAGLAAYFPDTMDVHVMKNGTCMHSIKCGACISVDQLYEFNAHIESNPTCRAWRMAPIVPLRGKDKDVKSSKFPNRATIQYLIAWLRREHGVDVAPGVAVTDIVDRARRDKEYNEQYKKLLNGDININDLTK